jgi:hypothetical protein
MKTANPVVKAIGELIVALRTESGDDLQEALDAVDKFGNSWLMDGEEVQFPGTKRCCLADTDVTEALKEILEVKIGNLE